MEKIAIEKGPIRPPSEANSLLIRATRNCPWNKCAFCSTYQGRKFNIRTVEEIGDDIGKAKRIADRLTELTSLDGSGDRVSLRAVNCACEEGEIAEESVRSVAAWLYHGGESVFIQDADSMIMKTNDLVRVIGLIRETFPAVRNITSYCRFKTAVRKPAADLRVLHDAGLTRVHAGLESGFDPLLRFMKKGITASEQVEGGRKLKDAGFSLCTYVMPGLGGRKWSGEHAEETARVVSMINPDVVRLRTLHASKGSHLHTLVQNGAFEPLTEEEILQELRAFIDKLDGIETTIVSDHVVNLLEELTGRLPEDKPRLLATIDNFFSLSSQERLVFRVGRRRGIYHRLSDLGDKDTFLWLKSVVDQYMGSDPGLLEKELEALMHSFI